MLLLCSMRDNDSAITADGEALSSPTLRLLLLDAAARGIRYREALDDRPVSATAEALAGLDRLREPLPERGTDAGEVLALVDEIGSPATVTMAGGRYFGFVNGSSLPVTVASNWLATAWNQNCALYVMSPAGAMFEDVALRWTVEALRLPPTCDGALVTGAAMANFTALAAARHAVLQRAGWDVDNQGLFGAPPITVVVGAEVHASVIRVLGLLGLGRTRVVTVPVDGQGRIRADALPSIAGPTIVCIQAGNVNSGGFDPAEAICAWAHAGGAWVHVDGAFGLWARAVRSLDHLTAGYELPDSWATDAHKWLNVPYDCGVALVREPSALRAAMSLTAAYLPASSLRDPIDYSPDSSRRARGVDVWAAYRYLGREGLAEQVERCCRHAARMAAMLGEAGFEILNDVELNQVLVGFCDEAEARRVIGRIQADGVCWCGGTRWQGRDAMRISVSSWATTDADVERSVAAILEAAR